MPHTVTNEEPEDSLLALLVLFEPALSGEYSFLGFARRLLFTCGQPMTAESLEVRINDWERDASLRRGQFRRETVLSCSDVARVKFVEGKARSKALWSLGFSWRTEAVTDYLTPDEFLFQIRSHQQVECAGHVV